MYLILFSLLILAHIYFVTMLFWLHNRLYHHDVEIARKIDFALRTKYPDFDTDKDYVYFFGHLPYQEDEKFRLPNSESFGGSFLFGIMAATKGLLNLCGSAMWLITGISTI